MYKVSILIPVYNTEKTLRRCLESVLNQTLKEIEIIITNDGSTDKSQSIIEEYANKDNRIRYFSQENKGLGETRNNGIVQASGEYIAFLDSDDWVDLNYYESMYIKAKKTDADIVISSYIAEFDLNERNSVIRFRYNENDKEKYLRDLLKGNISGFSWNKLYKKSLIKDEELRFPKRNQFENVEDQYFSIRAIYKSQNISFMNESSVHYFINRSSIVQKYQKTLIKDILTLYNENKNLFREDLVNGNSYIKDMDSNLVKGIVAIVNNEFKPTRKVSILKKIKIIKQITSFNEYLNIINSIIINELSLIDKLYFKLLRNKCYIILYILAKFRCKLMYWRIKIND